MNRIFELLDWPADRQEQDSFDVLQSALEIEPYKAPSILPELDTSQQLNLDFSDADLTSFDAPQNFKIKKQRGNKKDNFNYEQHIKKELLKMDVANMTKKDRKVAVQKIRNRMSAQ